MQIPLQNIFDNHKFLVHGVKESIFLTINHIKKIEILVTIKFITGAKIIIFSYMVSCYMNSTPTSLAKYNKIFAIHIFLKLIKD